MNPKQLVFNFDKGIIEEEETKDPPHDGVCVLSLSDIKSHALASIKFFCVSACERETCKGCVLDGYRLFISRMSPLKFYNAAHESNLTVIDTVGRMDLPARVITEIEQSTQRFGLKSSFSRDELKAMMHQPLPSPEQASERQQNEDS